MNHILTISDRAGLDLSLAAEKLSIGLAEHFPAGRSAVVVRPIVGALCLCWEHTNRTEYANGISLNDKGSTRGLIHVNADGSVEIDKPTTYYNAREIGAPFRKIKAATATEGVEKLLRWYAKAAPLIKALG